MCVRVWHSSKRIDWRSKDYKIKKTEVDGHWEYNSYIYWSIDHVHNLLNAYTSIHICIPNAEHLYLLISITQFSCNSNAFHVHIPIPIPTHVHDRHSLTAIDFNLLQIDEMHSLFFAHALDLYFHFMYWFSLANFKGNLWDN